MTYTTKIMLSGIAKIKTGYFDNINKLARLAMQGKQQ